MREALFDDLIQSVRDAGAYLRGEAVEVKIHTVPGEAPQPSGDADSAESTISGSGPTSPAASRPRSM